MIEKLILRNFGKFSNAEFDLSAVTLFLGMNEAGKTTLFDALAQEISNPRANKKYGRDLRERYGEVRDVELLFDDQDFRIDEDEFFNLYAIRSGSINLDMSAGSWLEKVKAGLFTGGIDPGRLRDKFMTLASHNGSLKHNKDLKYLETEREKLAKNLASKMERRAGLLHREENSRKIENELSEAVQEGQSEEAAIAELENELDLERRILERKRLNELLLAIDEGRKRKAELKSMERFSRSEIEQLDHLLEELNSGKERFSEMLGRKQLLTDRISEGRRRVQKIEAESTATGGASGLASEFLDRLRRFMADPPCKNEIRWHPGLLAVSVLSIVSGVAVFLALKDAGFKILALVTGFSCAAIFSLAARRTEQLPDSAKRESFMRHLKDEWRLRADQLGAGAGDTLAADTPEGLVMELQNLRAKIDRSGEELERGKIELREQQSALDEAETATRKARDVIRDRESAIREWLDRREITDRDAYIEKTVAYQNLIEKQSQWNLTLKAELATGNMASEELLKQDCQRRLEVLDRDLVPNTGRTADEIKRLEVSLKEKRQRAENIRQRLSEINGRLEREKGEISGSLGNLPEEMTSLERRIAEEESKIESRKLDREAASLASEIFNRISEDSDTVLNELSLELSRRFGEIVPEIRRLTMKGLNTERISLADAGGEERPVKHLSNGTRDAFLLAARLVLAAKSYQGAGIMILDEPFIALDTVRTERALRFIKKFSAEKGWQIIIFSKDAVLDSLARSIFDKITINRIDRKGKLEKPPLTSSIRS